MNDETHDGNSTVKKSNTSWHRLLAKLLEMVLSPFDIDVQPDVSVMTDPPEADILLLRRKTSRWTEAQRARLPDGIRDSDASHILIEFKITQSLNEKALAQAVGYDFFYKQAKELPPQELQTVLLSAKKPRSDTLTFLGYQKTQHPGVYRTQNSVTRNVLLLSLNELSNEPHNLWLKCFASRKAIKRQVFKKLKAKGFVSVTHELEWFINGLMRLWFGTILGEQKMIMEFTPEEVTEMGKQLEEVLLADLTVDDILARFGQNEVLSHIKPIDRLAGLEPKEVLPHFKPVDRLAGLEPKEVLPHFKPEVIEDYLKQLKRQPK
jgi:hypothetical protein